MSCVECGEKLLLNHCPYGHSQHEEPDTIDEAMKQHSRTLGSVFRKAKDQGLVNPINPTSWDGQS